MRGEDRTFLTGLFEAAVAAADPVQALQGNLPEKPAGRTIVIGCGKGAAQLAAAFEDLWDGPLEGVVVTRYGYAQPCRQLRVMEASHPVPDAAGMTATEALFEAVSGLTDEQALNKALLASGAPIGVMNAIRKHASRIKGGRLAAAAHPARVVSLVVSDVPGDDPAEVASGPTVPSGVTLERTLEMIRNRGIDLPERITAHLASGDARAPMPGDEVFARHEVHVIASARLSLEAAAARAGAAGVPAVILSDAIEGEARDVGLVHAAIASERESGCLDAYVGCTSSALAASA